MNKDADIGEVVLQEEIEYQEGEKDVVNEDEDETEINSEDEETLVVKKKLIKKKKLKKEGFLLSENMLNSMILVVFSALLTLLCASPVGFLLYKKIPKPVGVIDLQAIVMENQREITAAFTSSEYISEEQKSASIARAQAFTTKLNDAVEKKAEDCGCVLVNKAAVLTEAREGIMIDYTNDIRKMVK